MSGNGVAGPELGFQEAVVDQLPTILPDDEPVLEPSVHASEEFAAGMGPPLDRFRISDITLERLARNGITSTTEVQAGTFNLLFDGKDVIAKSRTGTGKTLAFALPIMERLHQINKERPRQRGDGPGCIVLAPTRELAKQVAREMMYIGEGLGLSVECFYGGSSYSPQENALRRGVDVVVGTPGRIIDHLDRGNLRLEKISFAVLDEADEMLSMGFAQDVETIFETLPPRDRRQVILFSATVPRWVKSLAAQFQKPDVESFDAVTTGSMAATTVRHCAVRVPEREESRASLLADVIAVHSSTNPGSGDTEEAFTPSRAIVFTQTKREADELATSGALDGCGAAVLHGDVSQRQREVTLSQFRKGQFQVLVATDVAARGLDISGVDVVVQYRVPRDTEAYIHRSGRTGRAGKSGTAVVMYSDREMGQLKQLERDCKIRFDMEAAPAPEAALEAAVDVAIGNVSTVDERVLKHLLPRAEEIVNGGEDTVETIAALLAMAGRRTRLEDRSVLSGENGMRTVHITHNGSLDLSAALAIRFINELARRENIETRVGLIRLCRDGSAVADLPSEGVDGLIEAAERLGDKAELKLGLAVGVPALKDDRRRSDRRRFGDRRGGDRRGGGGNSRSFRERDGHARFGGRDRFSGRDRSSGRDRFSDYGRGDSRNGRDSGRGGYRGRRSNDFGGGRGRRSPDFLSDDF